MKDSSSADTQASDSPADGGAQAGFRAHLRDIGLHDLVRLQGLVRASGVFVVLCGARTGSLHFARGELLHAETEGLTGDVAALEILSWREGEFINSERDVPETTTVGASLESLLLRVAKGSDGSHPSEPPLTTATGVRRRMEGPGSFRSTHPGLGVPTSVQMTQRLAAAATPGVAALVPRTPARAGEPRHGVTNVLIAPHGVLIDGNGADPDSLGSQAAYLARLTDLVGLAMGAGDTRSLKVRTPSSELLVRRYADGQVSATLSPVDPSADASPSPSTPPPPAKLI